jgi:ABC-2 type transport system permease protein
MVFLGGSLYSLDMLPPFWQTITYFNPVVYLINGLKICISMAFLILIYGLALVSMVVVLIYLYYRCFGPYLKKGTILNLN